MCTKLPNGQRALRCQPPSLRLRTTGPAQCSAPSPTWRVCRQHIQVPRLSLNVTGGRPFALRCAVNNAQRGQPPTWRAVEQHPPGRLDAHPREQLRVNQRQLDRLPQLPARGLQGGVLRVARGPAMYCNGACYVVGVQRQLNRLPQLPTRELQGTVSLWWGWGTAACYVVRLRMCVCVCVRALGESVPLIPPPNISPRTTHIAHGKMASTSAPAAAHPHLRAPHTRASMHTTQPPHLICSDSPPMLL